MQETDPVGTISQIDYRVVTEVLEYLASPRSLSVAIMLRYGCWNDIVELVFNPLDYNSLEDARSAFAATELLRKASFLPLNINREEVAYQSFFAAESVCAEVNSLLLGGNPRESTILFMAARKISRILSNFDPAEMLSLSGWGPGVTLTLRGSSATLFEKFRHDGEVTPAFFTLCNFLISQASPHWKIRPKVFEGNRVVTVPKSAKTDRVIAVEPSLNLFFQKGVGAMIRRRLKRWGVDLNDQRRNQDLARSGSYTGELCTVDFSAASDTISWALVQELLPPQWFEVLEVLRSPRGLVKGSLIEYEKFSSMGNGYTFELESLIFFSIALAVAEEMGVDSSPISVFGDDVIIPSEMFSRFSDVSAAIGFTVNTKKSFSTSYFRESCGGYFWNGVSIKPPRLVESLSNRNTLIKFHNRLVEYVEQEEFRNSEPPSVLRILRQAFGRKVECPRSYGDQGFWVPLQISSGKYRFSCISFTPDMVTADDHAVYLSHLYLLSKRDQLSDNDYQRTVVEGIAIGNTCPVPRKGRYRISMRCIPYGVPSLGIV